MTEQIWSGLWVTSLDLTQKTSECVCVCVFRPFYQSTSAKEPITRTSQQKMTKRVAVWQEIDRWHFVSSPAGSLTELRWGGALCRARRERPKTRPDWTLRRGSAWPACGPTWSRRAGSSTSRWGPVNPAPGFPKQCPHNLEKTRSHYVQTSILSQKQD